MADSTPASKPEEPKNLLTTLLSGDNKTKMLIALLILSGGGNILATKQGTDTTSGEMAQAIQEIHHLHDALAGSIERQKQIIEMLQDLAKPTPSPQ